MTAEQIRQKFLDFMASKSHAIIPSAPVVPEHDPTTLFNIAGMQPLTPNLLGEPHPAGKRLANVQKCIRTVDIDEVGDDSHATFMEMLGFWSLGDYFNETAIPLSWEFFTKALGLDPAKLAVTVFAGDADATRDEESARIWREQGVPTDRIFYYDKAENWWPPTSNPGPCGPCTEIFFWVGDGVPTSEPIKDERWLEIGNNVLMQYERGTNGKVKPIAQKNIDTGLGFERIVGVVQGKRSVYETDLFVPVIKKIRKLATQADERAERIVADHLKAVTFMIADGVRPSNTERGYILRRLVRRAIRQAKHLGIESPFTAAIAEVVVGEFSGAYPELKREQKVILEELLKEENKFAQTINQGLKELKKFIDGRTPQRWTTRRFSETSVSSRGALTGEEAFYLFETYGFPFELTLEVAKENELEVENNVKDNFQKAQQNHQAKSRAGAEQKFAGGLADDSESTVKLHTATHLLNAALKDVLGEHVKQRGSNITAERLRFDFAHPQKLTDEEANQVEALVNQWIKEDLPVNRREMPLAEAERVGAQMEFGHKYPAVVSVYFVGDPESAYSKEFCGGPHVERTGVIGEFKLGKQESVGAGIRRVKATVS